jgi:RNA polymerase sigma-70 factor, ECF subfamily
MYSSGECARRAGTAIGLIERDRSPAAPDDERRRVRRRRRRDAIVTGPSTGASPAVRSPGAREPSMTLRLDPESRQWLTDLRGREGAYDDAVGRLHALLLGAARFEVARRAPGVAHLRGDELPDIAMEAADDAVMSVLRRLDDFRGDSRFTTWAYKFALLEAAVKLRRRAWQGREVPLASEAWSLFSTGQPSPHEDAEQRQLLDVLQRAIRETLTPHQREVLVALALNGVPIDVLADRLGTTRGALYKTLHDARRKLRARLAACGLAPDGLGEAS